MMSSTSSSSGGRLGEGPDAGRRARGTGSPAPASRLATAAIGQPARARATPSAVPTAPAPTMPMIGGSSGLGVTGAGARWSSRWTRRRGGGGPVRAPGSRSIPGAASARLGRRAVERRAAPRREVAPGPSSGRGPRRRTARYACTPRVYRASEEPPRCPRSTPSAPERRSARACRTSIASPPWTTGWTSARAPVTVKILLENVLRHAGGGIVRAEDVEALAAWRPGVAADAEIPFMPARVLLQDFTGVPAVVDLAVMRDAMAELGGDPARVNPLVPADLVIDHSVQVDRFGTPGRVRLQRRARVRAQRRALPAPALGADAPSATSGRAAGDRHRPPGEPGVPRDGRGRPPGRARAGRLPRHARRHRLAHHDDQRPRRPRLRRRRASRRRPCCWASRSTSRCRTSSASG